MEKHQLNYGYLSNRVRQKPYPIELSNVMQLINIQGEPNIANHGSTGNSIAA